MRRGRAFMRETNKMKKTKWMSSAKSIKSQKDGQMRRKIKKIETNWKDCMKISGFLNEKNKYVKKTYRRKTLHNIKKARSRVIEYCG